MYKILARKIQDNKLLWLLKEIIYSNEGKKGLAIGNYTSQMFANIYLNVEGKLDSNMELKVELLKIKL